MLDTAFAHRGRASFYRLFRLGVAVDQRKHAKTEKSNLLDGLSKDLPSVKAFAFALLCVFIFFAPSLAHHSRTAGFLYTGDVLGFYWPTTMKMLKFISSFQLNTIDAGVFNGSSDFYRTPNQYGVQPLFVIYSLLFGITKPSQEAVGHGIVVILAVHCFLGSFFTIRLAERFFGLSFGAAAFASVIFIFGFGTLGGLGEPGYLLSWSALPWCIYAALQFQQRPTLLRLPLAMFPTVLILLGGYVPLAVGTLFLAVATILYLAATEADRSGDRVWSLGLAFVPVACGVLVVAPYLLGVLSLMHASPSAHAPSLFFSAHQLSELPQTVLRLFSGNPVSAAIPGPFYEESVTWGLVGAYIAFMFLLRPSAAQSLSPREWMHLKASFAVYALTTLAIYGPYTPVSDMVYYFVPQVGGMHIYQRFLAPAGLALGLSMALMLTALIRIETGVPGRIGAVACLTVTFVAAYHVAFHPDAMVKAGVTNTTVFELIVLSLFACALVVPGRTFKFACAIFLIALPTLNGVYNYSRQGNDLADRRAQQPILLDPAVQAGIVDYMKARSGKALIKYMDLTPMWGVNGIEPFSKSFPYLVEKDLKLSSYTGFNFYLTPPGDYMQRMPVQGTRDLRSVQMNPDWSYVRRTGADFVVALDQDLPGLVRSGLVKDASKDVLKLPGGVFMAPLAPDDQSQAPVFDNGYFRVEYPEQPLPPMRNIALHQPARQSSQYGNADASRAVDGGTDGVFGAGSVSHTGEDPNAWLDVDLGKTQPIDAIALWNRSDCCDERLGKLWILVSNEPFADTDTAEGARARPGVWSRFVLSAGPKMLVKTPDLTGRYVRIQLDGQPDPAGRFLSLAELEVLQGTGEPAPQARPAAPLASGFKTNGGSLFQLDVNAPAGANVVYELWRNNGLRFSVDGKAVQPLDESGVTVIPVGPGTHRVEVTYRNYLQTLFWTVYLTFLGVVAIVAALWLARQIRSLIVFARRSGRSPRPDATKYVER